MTDVVNHPQVLINTSYGPLTVELYPEKAPLTVTNFLTYVDQGFYAGTIFHRVIDAFMIQGGGITTSLQPKAVHAPIALESNNALSNVRGALAMARTSEANSATSQFYINTVDNTGLNYKSATSPGYAVFGKVVDGMDVVDAIENAHTFNVTVSATTTYQNLPFPKLLEIYSAERYTQSAALTPTTYTSSVNSYGVTQATFNGQRADYGVKLNTNGTLSVMTVDGAHSSATLTNVTRLQFNDTKVAYDMQGAAGETVRLINAAFGYTYLSPDIVKLGLDLFDQKMTMEKVAELALGTGLWKNLAGGADHAAFVKTVYTHVMGAAPDAATQGHFQGILERGEMTQAQLLALAAETSENAQFVDLVGLAHSGIEYFVG